MSRWLDFVYAFARTPWHLILFAAAGFVGFFYAGTRHDHPKS
jgi:hypothetical protein